HGALEQALYRYLEKTVDAVFLTDVQEAMPEFDVTENNKKLEKFFRFMISYMEESPPQTVAGEKE
ncbi:MAG: hypothetical protein ACFNLO_08565, partial [Selenomonas massiliensis]